jgi:hypothetical protein
MVDNGGMDLAFRVFRQQLEGSGRKSLFRKLWDELSVTLKALIVEVMPQGVDSANRRKLALDKCRVAIAGAIMSAQVEDDLINVSHVLRTLLDCSGENLDPIPRYIRRSQTWSVEVPKWVTKQLSNWVNHKLKGGVNGYECLGIRSETDLSTFLFTLTEAVDVAAFSQWLHKHFGHLNTREQCLRARHFAAVSISKEILLPEADRQRPHRSAPDVQKLFGMFAAKELVHDSNDKYKYSPHVYHVIDPFHRRLNELAKTVSSSVRPPQPGDAELQLIIESNRTSRSKSE